MYRCMTCDVRKTGEPVFIRLAAGDETIGVCPKCAAVIRSYNTMSAMVAGEYDENPCCDDPDCAAKETP
jgi:hypothetical protein